MKLRMWGIVGMTLLLALPMGPAWADQAPKISKATNKADFDLVVAAVKQQMAPGGRYEFVDGRNRDTVNQRLGEMQKLFDQYGTVDKMDQASKVTLYNDQELIDGILTQDDSNRQVCTREASLGSNIPHVSCRTYGQIRRDQSGTQSALRQMEKIQGQVMEINHSPAKGQVSH
jgi:hypothetical protein